MKKVILFLFCSAVLAGSGWLVWHRSHQNHASQSTGTQGSAHYSLDDPSSIWVVVNKSRALNPKTFTPHDLVVPRMPLRNNITDDEKYVREAMAPALEKLVAAAAQQNVHLTLQSGYRSYTFQVNLYNSYVQMQGQATADSQSARPGYSEHQTGLAVDVGGISNPSCDVAACFANTTEGKWLTAHAADYGFIIRYPADKTAITGYEYEPWHIRYVGTELSIKMQQRHIETLEEYFGLPAAPTYK